MTQLVLLRDLVPIWALVAALALTLDIERADMRPVPLVVGLVASELPKHVFAGGISFAVVDERFAVSDLISGRRA